MLARLFGGQGTINVPSWSPDSKKLAFVSYELLPEESVNGTIRSSMLSWDSWTQRPWSLPRQSCSSPAVRIPRGR